MGPRYRPTLAAHQIMSEIARPYINYAAGSQFLNGGQLPKLIYFSCGAGAPVNTRDSSRTPFSKKLSHLKVTITLHFAYYNFCRVHQSLKKTPCMAAGLTDHVWDVKELFS